MKAKIFHIAVLAIILASCGGNDKGQSGSGLKFKAQERTSSLSDEEREEAIDQKRSELAAQDVNVDSMLSIRGVTFSVVPPVLDKNLPLAASDKMGFRLLQIASQNGISGLCKNPVLAMVCHTDNIKRELTATAPQKVIVSYEVTIYCVNTLNNEVYASCPQKLTGVGQTLEDASNNAANEFRNTPEMQKMISTASQRALKWYGTTGNVQKFVDDAVSNRNYALAMAMLSSVPEQAKDTYAYATKRHKEVSSLFFEEKAAELLGDLEGAIAAAGEEFYPDLAEYLRVIPERSKAYTRAKELYDSYVAHVKSVKEDEREKAHKQEMQKIANEHAEAMQELKNQKQQIDNEHAEAMALLKLEKQGLDNQHSEAMSMLSRKKITAPYESNAALEEMKISASLQKHEMWSSTVSSVAESIGNGMRGGLFGENGMFGKGGLFGFGSFAEPLSNAVGGFFGRD